MQITIDTENPIVRGPLTLFALFSNDPEADPYIPGPEAAERKLFEVHERGDGARVPELEIENRSDLPLLLIEGEMLLGAKQNRTLNVSVICPPHVSTVIPVSCVEAGRWGAARKGARSRYHAGISLRNLKTRSVRDSLLRGEGKRSDQHGVWESVAGYAAKFQARSATSSYDEVLAQVEDGIESLVAGLEPVPGQRGVLVAIAGQPRSLDFFDRPGTLRAYWKSLIAGYASDAMGERPEPTSSEAAKAFLDRVLIAKLETTAAVGLGAEFHAASEGITATALRWGDAAVHVAAFVDGT
jgi:hypothetical protein